MSWLCARTVGHALAGLDLFEARIQRISSATRYDDMPIISLTHGHGNFQTPPIFFPGNFPAREWSTIVFGSRPTSSDACRRLAFPTAGICDGFVGVFSGFLNRGLVVGTTMSPVSSHRVCCLRWWESTGVSASVENFQSLRCSSENRRIAERPRRELERIRREFTANFCRPLRMQVDRRVRCGRCSLEC